MTWSDHTRPLLAVLAILVMGCGHREPGFALLPLVQAKSFTGLTFRRSPEITALKIDNERRPAVLAAPGTWTWRGEVPEKAVLHVGVQALPAVWRAVSRLDAEVSLRQGGTREILDVAKGVKDPTDPSDPTHPSDPHPPRWLDMEIDLAPWAGREVTLEFTASLTGLPPSYRDANLVAWSPVVLESGEAREERGGMRPTARPNVLFIVVDTLRADHLTPYGYKVRDTTPEIQRRLAGPGTVVENAYSQAPWTLPSVVSFMTGRYPGELLGGDAATFGIPDGVKTLAERMAAAGYDTGGFIANPVLHEGAGYERGFHTSYAPPADIEWIRRHADDLNRHAVPWLRAHQRRPFFLYVHYADPHDPYENPDMIAGRAQFMPDYKGNVSGDWIHGIYSGKLQLADPALDLAYIKALYDGEVHYVDRHIGALLDEIDPEVLKNTLIVLTADHGEELYDHGGWKHGQTLYEEQIHVPLIFRWDGRIPAGKRLPGTVRLLDLVPTLMAAAGAKPDPAWEGVNLLPALTGKEPVPRRAAFSEGLSGGPQQAAVVLDQKKLLLFNRAEPFQPTDELQDFLWRRNLDRLQRAELYDLGQDAGERRNLLGAQPDLLSTLEPLIHLRLSRELEGLWVIPDGLPEGARLSGSITFERAPALWTPYFLGPADHAGLIGGLGSRTMRFDLVGERLTKGLRIQGDVGKILAVEAVLDGRPLPPGAVRIGTEAPWGNRSATPLLRLWTVTKNAERRTTVDPETEKRLTNLGYIGTRGKRKTP